MFRGSWYIHLQLLVSNSFLLLLIRHLLLLVRHLFLVAYCFLVASIYTPTEDRLLEN